GSDIAARAVLHQLLVQVLRDHDAAIHARLTTGPRSPRILRAIEWMDRHIGEDYAVEDAARAVGLGVSRFHEQFLREVGYTPADYRARRRVELARHALRHSDEPITSMALRLGFSSSQYF